MTRKTEKAHFTTTRTIGWSALAAIIALTTVPATAYAQDRENRRNGAQNQSQQPNQNRGDAYRNRGQQQPRQRVQQQPAPQQNRINGQINLRAVPNPQTQRVEQPRQNQNWQNNDRRQNTERRNTTTVRPAAPQTNNDRRQNNDWRNNNNNRPNEVRRDNDRRPNDVRRDNDRRDSNWENWRNGNNNRDNNWRNNNNARPNQVRRDNDRWDRTWRNNNRYNWQSHRTNNRNTYRLGRYYAPHNNYSYRRLGIGLTLGSVFYSNRYWVNDPWQYRLPEVYGPYRWVRYYDDVLLVNTYSGEVVDVIYDFFW